MSRPESEHHRNKQVILGFRTTTEVEDALKKLCAENNRTKTQQVEFLILQAAKKLSH
jgi:hypothetical protein